MYRDYDDIPALLDLVDDNDWDDDDDECEGHESLRGDSMGMTTYCNGTCK